MAVTESSNESERNEVVIKTEEAPMHGNLAQALAAFQAERPRVVKDSTNPHFGNKYASLDAFEAQVLPLLAKHGLAWTCLPKVTLEGELVGLIVEYRLMHGPSGGELVGLYPLVNGTPQQIGMSLTYAKRYLLSAVTGVSADDDDDGEAASVTPPARPQQRQQREAPADVDWQAVIKTAEGLGDVAELRKLYVARGVKRAPAEVQAAFAAHVKSITPEPAPAPAAEGAASDE